MKHLMKIHLIFIKKGNINDYLDQFLIISKLLEYIISINIELQKIINIIFYFQLIFYQYS